jgi:lipopolysaccharide/colanic/teichoic acid biosynthesis glycosyltransferase
MIKFRSMVVRADRTGVDSTAGDDPRVTAVGRFIRRFKLDELPQLINVVVGQMSLVGPRPNVPRETGRYTDVERTLLSVRPGVTDLASIVFADESEILRGSEDPDVRYNRLIRPWKSRLGILYVQHAGSVGLDGYIICLTLLSAVRRRLALAAVGKLVRRLGGGDDLARVAMRSGPLEPAPPPGGQSLEARRAATSPTGARSDVS